MMNDNQEPQFSSEEAAAEKTVPSSDVETPEIEEALKMGETNNANDVASSADAQIADIDASSIADMGNVSTAAIQPAAKTPNKKLRIIIIIGAVIIALALIMGGIVIANFLEENSLKAQIAADLSKDPAVSELVLPGELFDETGFEVEDVQIDGLVHTWFSNEASANVLASLKNDCIHGLNRYAIKCNKVNGEWVLDSVEAKSENYEPYAPIPDDVILSNLGRLITEVDSLSAVNGIWPIDLVDYYGEDTTGSITANDLHGANDEVSIAIETVYNDQTLKGNLVFDLFWAQAKDSTPSWTIGYASATDDTYLAASSIPHSGVNLYATEAEQQDYLNMTVANDEFFTSYIEELDFEKDDHYTIIGFQNIPNNKVDMEFTITLDDTGEVLYQSPRLSPNTSIDAIAFTRDLEPGIYNATITIKVFEQGTNRPTQLNSTMTEPITINVK